MFQRLVSRNDDIRRLVEKGYAIGFDGAYMIVRDIPYLDSAKALHWGAFVAKLVFVDQERVAQDDHQIFFAGTAPHNVDGTPVANLNDRGHSLRLSEVNADVVVQRQFSNKPRPSRKFENFYDKVESYTTLIAGPAMNLFGANPYTFRARKDAAPPSVFKFQDTLTSRAEISELSKKFENDVIAIIGLGGTGAFVLDFMVKTPVKELRAFDLDEFHVHNAFRSPGRLMEDELGKRKAEVYQSRYANFRHGLTVTPRFIDSMSADQLAGVTFAFVCVDKGSSRAEIFDLLINSGIPFIDVGMGLSRSAKGALKGMLRTTYFPPKQAQEIRDQRLAETSDAEEDIYKTNIQIGELNALNACLAVIRFKQLRGFYIGDHPYYHILFDLFDLKTVSEALADAHQT